MPIRFTHQGSAALGAARNEALELRHYYIGGAHLLLGLLHQDTGIAAAMLADLGLSLETVREQVKELRGTVANEPTVHVPHTPRMARVFQLSQREAHEHGHGSVNTGHLLLGLLEEGGGDANRILSRYISDPQRVRARIRHLLADPAAAGEVVDGAGDTRLPDGGDEQNAP